jgi:hypothetical protein
VIEDIDTKTRQPGYLKREISLEEFFEILALPVVHNVIQHVVDRLVIQRRYVDPADIAVDTDHGRQPGRQMQI